MPDIDPAAIRERAERARALITDLCRPRTDHRRREWMMSIPARPDYDADLVFDAVLNDVDALLARLDAAEAERDRLRAALGRVTVAADAAFHAYRLGYHEVGEERHRLYLAVKNAALAPAE